MDIETFEFPAIADGLARFQEKYCDMVNRYRDHTLSPEELDWMDWANNTLTEI